MVMQISQQDCPIIYCYFLKSEGNNFRREPLYDACVGPLKKNDTMNKIKKSQNNMCVILDTIIC